MEAILSDQAPPPRGFLDAALAFAQQSVAIAIVPLALATVAPEARADTLNFGPVVLNPGEIFNPNGSGYSGGSHVPVNTVGVLLTLPHETANGVDGMRYFVPNLVFVTDVGGPLAQYASSGFRSDTVTGSLPAGSSLLTSYSFNLNASPNISNLTWTLSGSLWDSFGNVLDLGTATGTIETGAGSPVTFSGVLDPTPALGESFEGYVYYHTLSLTYTAAAVDPIFLSMGGFEQGITLTGVAAAVPEPATVGLLAGLGALGLAWQRRRLRRA